jgi:Cft2 family RNA processing exonuclease
LSNRPSLDNDATPQYGRGLYLRHLDLWLDARDPQPLSIVSHAHGDHLGDHEAIITTPETARIARYRRGSHALVELPYGETWEEPGGRYALTLYPAGHVLGSAQVLITEPDGRRTVYTGDFKLRDPAFGPPAPVIPCDVLITEATFGRPDYCFPPDEACKARLHTLCHEALAQGITPVVFAYTLGKGQEALQLLLEGNLPVSVHGSIANLCDIYQSLGERFEGDWQRYTRESLPGRVLLAPTQTRKAHMVRNIERRRTIYLSGWGMDRNAKWRLGVDEVIPLSDHADWPDLLRYVEEASPRRVYTVHGFPDLAGYLRARGLDALHLETHQMALL